MASLPTTPPHLPPSNVEGDGSSSRSNSPDGNCPICLGKVNNKAFTDACFHTFCFVCLLEWSKIRATCPLCKTSFKSIIHNVVSNDVYDRYHLKPTNTGSLGEDGRGRRFRYSTTMTEEHRYEVTLRRNRALERRHQRAHQAHLQAANEERRRMIYRAGLWVRHIGSNRFTRFRDISPEFFRENPATTHRLVPWLRRELNILFSGEDHVTFMTQYILSLIPSIHMQTEEFHEHLRPFLYGQTEHFIHEFVSFARSPYDMSTYDQIAQYDLTAVPPQSQPTLSRPLSPPQRTSNYNDVITLSSDDDVVEVHNIPTLRSLLQSDSASSSPSQAASEQVEALDLSSTHNPEPPPASYQYDQDQPGPSGISGGPIVQVKSEHESGQENVISDDSSDIEIVGFVKPFDERTPECLIILTSSTEEDEETQRLQSRHANKGEGKRHQKKKHTAESGSMKRPQEASHHEGRLSDGGKTHRHSHKKKHKHHKHRTHRKSHRHHLSRQEEATSHPRKHHQRSRSRSRSKSTCSSSSHQTVRSKVIKPRPEEPVEYRGRRGSSSSSQTHRSHSRSRLVQGVEQLFSRDTRERDRVSILPDGSQQKTKSSEGHSWRLHWRNKDRDDASRSWNEVRDHSRSTGRAEDAATFTQHSHDQHYQSTTSRKHRTSDDDRAGRERSKIRRTDDSGPHLTMVISRKRDTQERSSSSNDVVSTKSSHGHRRKHKKHKRHKHSHTAVSSRLSPVPYAHHSNVYRIDDDANDGDRSSDSTEEETDSFM